MKAKITTSETPTGGHAITIESGRPSIWAIIPGLIIMLIGLAILAPDIYVAIVKQQEPHLSHLIYGGLVAIMGVVVPFYRQVIPGVKQLLIVLGDSSLPIVGGRRRTDPPAPTSDVPPVPPGAPSP